MFGQLSGSRTRGAEITFFDFREAGGTRTVVVSSPGDAAREARTTLALNVRRLMRARGYANVTELSTRSTVGTTTLYEVLRGVRGATLDTIAKLAWVFGISIAKLLEAPKRRDPDA